MDRLNFNHLFYFYVVANEGSIKASAEKLHVSQPTISDQIKLLEEFLNCSLFLRVNRGLILTKEGELVLDYSKKIFDLSKEMTSRLRNKIQLPKKCLDIGLTHFMSHYFLYDYLLPLFQQNEVSINITENDRHILLADLEEGELDMVFTDSKDGVSNSLNSYRVGLNKTFVCANKALWKKNDTFPGSLNGIPFFNYTNDSFLKYEIELFFSKNGLTPKVIGEADDIDLFQVVTEKALGFVIVPEVAKNRLCLNKDVIVLGEIEELQTAVWGIVKKNYTGLGYKLLKAEL